MTTKRLAAILIVAASTCATAAVVGTARAATGELPGGAALSIDIVQPADGATIVAGTPITVEGVAAVGESAADKDTDLVFVIDRSFSTASSSGVDCDGDGDADTVLECEKQAVIELVDQADDPRSPIAGVAVVTFASTAGVLLGLTDPALFDAQVLDAVPAPGGFTDFARALAAANDVLSGSTAAEAIVVLLTDGESGDDDGPAAPIAAAVKAFAIGVDATCSDADLQAAIGQGTSATCQEVDELADLAGVIAAEIGSRLDAVSVDGADVVEVTPGLPVDGPASVEWTATIDGLDAGVQSICATVAGSDAAGSSSVESCITVDVVPAGSEIVDCAVGGGECTASAEDTGRSALLFSAPPAFDETVVITPTFGDTEPDECGGATCRTGYDVGFAKPGIDGLVASITVTTTDRVPVRDRVRAAVFIDDELITAQCNNRWLIAALRDRFGIPEPIPCVTIQYVSGGRLEYFVKFDADPAFRFR